MGGCGGNAENQAFITWASQNAVACEDFNTPPAAAVAAFIEDKLGPARLGPAWLGPAWLVGLGESRHDTREQLLFKSLLVRQLIEHSGFRALILEESYAHVLALDRYLTTGEGDARILLNNLAGWYLWDTEEMLALFQWIREFNQHRNPDRQVRLYGTDITAPAQGVQVVLETLAAAGVEHQLNAQVLGLDLQRGDYWPATWERYNALSDQQRRQIAENYGALLAILATEKTRLTAHLSPQGYDHIRLMAEIGERGNAFFSTSDLATAGAIREAGMARVTLWVLNQEMEGEKAILWAHNLHVAKSTFLMPDLAAGALEPMGIHLSEALGDAYLAVGGTFGTGSYGPDLPPGELLFEPVAVDVMDGALAKVPLANFLLDLRGDDRDGPVNRWLQRERPWRAQGPHAVMVPGKSFDLVYFVSRITRSRPTPLALQRFQAMGRGQ